MSILSHDFSKSMEAALIDNNLKNQLAKFLNSDMLSPPDKSDLINVTCNVRNLSLKEARRLTRLGRRTK